MWKLRAVFVRSIGGFIHMFQSVRACIRYAVTASALSLLVAGVTSPAQAAGDLLVAPTRIVLDGARGTEVILSNTGKEVATYRISLELRRMGANGRLEDIQQIQANDTEKAALEAIRFAPKRVTLQPDQPQSIRINTQDLVSGPLPDGEYRAHLLFRAIPKAADATQAAPVTSGVSIQLTPIYGVTIPVIIRKGNLSATAALANPVVGRDADGPALQFDLSRKGTKSVFGEIYVTKPGIAEPVIAIKGIAVYPELEKRQVSIPITPDIASKLHGPVKISYREALEAGGATIAEIQTVLP
jgi:P pilus assembly chaperone PapD